MKNFLNLCLLSLLLSGCSVVVPNIEVCATAGVMSAGGDCAMTLSDDVRELNLDAWIAFLEPQPESVDPAGLITPARGAAVCQSADDFNKMKTALQQACDKLGRWCTYEAKQTLEQADQRVQVLQAKVLEKKRRRLTRQRPGAVPPKALRVAAP